MTTPVQTRAERRAYLLDKRRAEHKREQSVEYRAGKRRSERLRKMAFSVVVAIVLVAGGYLAFGDFLGQRGAPTTAGAISVQASMAGFTPGAVEVIAGEEVTLDFWTQDSSAHLERGVHTLVSDELGIYSELPGADGISDSRVAVRFTAPTQPGEYDIYCDTCCGGQDNPTMHGKIVVVA